MFILIYYMMVCRRNEGWFLKADNGSRWLSPGFMWNWRNASLQRWFTASAMAALASATLVTAPLIVRVKLIDLMSLGSRTAGKDLRSGLVQLSTM